MFYFLFRFFDWFIDGVMSIVKLNYSIYTTIGPWIQSIKDTWDTSKYVPEGVEGRVPYRGALEKIIEQLVGGVRASFGYTGNKNLDEFRKKTKFVRITSFGQPREL
mgnify:CR=1 FL=1